jgi:hypothetical protein
MGREFRRRYPDCELQFQVWRHLWAAAIRSCQGQDAFAIIARRIGRRRRTVARLFGDWRYIGLNEMSDIGVALGFEVDFAVKRPKPPTATPHMRQRESA